MYPLLSTEMEAIARCKAASILPGNAPFPADEAECRKLVASAGMLYCEKIIYKNKQGKLKFCRIVSSDESTLHKKAALFVQNNPDVADILPISISEPQTSFSMEAWHLFFAQGKALLDIDEFNSRIAAGHCRKLAIEQLEKGFDLKYEETPDRCTASRRQLDVLAEMIISGRLSPIPQREWENLTKVRATELISSIPAPKKKKMQPSAKIKKILFMYESLTKDEKNELFEIFNQNLKEE